ASPRESSVQTRGPTIESPGDATIGRHRGSSSFWDLRSRVHIPPANLSLLTTAAVEPKSTRGGEPRIYEGRCHMIDVLVCCREDAPLQFNLSIEVTCTPTEDTRPRSLTLGRRQPTLSSSLRL